MSGLDKRLPGEAAHAHRVAVYAVATGFELGLRGNALQTLKEAALLHDIGKDALPETALTVHTFTQEERRQMERHAVLAEALLDAIEWLSPCSKIIRHHHERWDGGGYPDRLKGSSTPLESRIIGVSEAFDAMSPRLYRNAAIEELLANAGTQFDPEVVEAFLRIESLIQPLSSTSQ